MDPSKQRPDTQFRFRVLADDLAALIARGELRPGERLPSVRELHASRGLAVGTICRALEELEARGLVDARPRSGYFVCVQTRAELPRAVHRPLTARSVPKSIVADRFASPSIDDARVSFVAATADRRLVALGGTSLAETLVPLIHLRRTARVLLGRDPSLLAGYAPPHGTQQLRRVIARRLTERGVPASSQDVVTTAGCLNAMRLALGVVTRPGDTVLVESPTFFALLPMLRELAVRVVQVPVAPGSGLDLDILEEALRTSRAVALVMTPTFHNPTGALMDLSARRALLALAAHHGITIVEDDVYAELFRGAPPAPPLAAIARGDPDVILCSSFSKTLAAGLRVGYVWSPRHAAALVRSKTASLVSTAALGERIIADYLQSGAHTRHLRRLRETLAGQVEAVRTSILHHFPAGELAITQPSGGYVLWLNLPGVDCTKLAARAAELSIAVLPGEACALDNRYRSFVRLSCGHPVTPRTDRAIATLARLAHECRGRA